MSRTEETSSRKNPGREIYSTKISLPHVDEELSHSPFLQVYRYPDELSLTASLECATAAGQEVPVAKLFAIDLFGKPKLLVFTNHGLIVLVLNAGLWKTNFWKVLGFVEKIPVIGWIIALLLGPIQALTNRVLKSDHKNAERLTSLSDETILETIHSKKKVKKLAKGIVGSWNPYSERLKELQPSLGVSIKHRGFSYVLGKIGVTTVRVMPLGRWLEIASDIGGAAEYTLPDRDVIPKLNTLLNAMPENIPIEHMPSASREVRFCWPEKIGVGKKRWSMYGAALLISLLFCVVGLFLLAGASGEEEAYWLAFAAGLGAIQCFILGRSVGHAVLYGVLPTMIVIITFAKEMGMLR